MGGCESCTARTNKDRNEWQVALRPRREDTIAGWLGIALAVIGVASWAVSGMLSHNQKKDNHHPIKKNNNNMLFNFLKHFNVLPHHKRQQTVVSYDDAASCIAFQKAIDEVQQHGEEMLKQNMKLKEEKMKVEKDLFMSLSDSLKQNHALLISNKVYRDLLDEYRKKEKDLSGRCEEMSNTLQWRESELNAKQNDLNDVLAENHDLRGEYECEQID
ncbi:hypothetical protein Tco_1395760 [Tanacetum coccineum]